MCGIAGFSFKDDNLIERMTDTLTHRGPDAEGFFSDENVSLGHRRLSIIDLTDSGKQPMFYKNFVIVFNGEIYNFREIKTELLLKNHRFISESDTEIVLHAYEEWGNMCVNRFNGMWAFCIYDRTKKQLFLSRDRFGKKPLYYFVGKEFIFSSELKAIRCHQLNLSISNQSLNFYFYQKYIGGSNSVFNEIKKLEPACYLIYNLETKTFETEKYYNLEHEIEKYFEIPIAERLKMISDLIPDTVIKRLISDVPVGSFLSGGLDSSLISAIVANRKKDFDTFSIGFTEATFNELPFSQIVARHICTNHHFRILGFEDEMIHNVISFLDEPFGDASLIPSWLLAKITREKVTVALSGDAGDEVFGGYDVYKAFAISKHFPDFIPLVFKKLINHLPASENNLTAAFKLGKFFKDYDKNPVRRHLNWLSQTGEFERKQLLGDNFLSDFETLEIPNGKTLLSIQINDFENYLAEDILKKVDIASMLNSLEVRVPFLDFRLVPLVLSLPDKYKIRGLKTKWFLKNYAENYIPRNIINRKKQGFSVPLAKWIKEKKMIQNYLTQKKYFNHGFINFETTNSMLRNLIADKSDYSRTLWLIFVFNLWWAENI
jgi:asparagine synthase (glutamine-hydrolysing)